MMPSREKIDKKDRRDRDEDREYARGLDDRVRVVAGLVEELRAHVPLGVHFGLPRVLCVGKVGFKKSTGSIASAFMSGGCSGFRR